MTPKREKHLIYKTLRVGTIVGFQAILLHAAIKLSGLNMCLETERGMGTTHTTYLP